MIPDPQYRRHWITLHAVGLLGVLGLALLGLEELVAWYATAYILGVGALEAWSVVRILLGRSGDATMSWTTWGFLEAGEGRAAFGRIVVVAVWFLLFVGLIWLFFPLAPGVKAFLVLPGGIWLWAHFFGRRKARQDPSTPRWGGGFDRPRSTDRESGPRLHTRPDDGGGRHPRQH